MSASHCPSHFSGWSSPLCAAVPTRTITLCYLHTFSQWGNSIYMSSSTPLSLQFLWTGSRYHSILLALHSFCHTHWLNLGGGAPCMNALLPSCCTGASSWKSWLGTCQGSTAGWPENLDRVPPSVQVQGKANNGSHGSPVPGRFLQLLESSCVSPTFSMWSLSIVCCAEAVQLSLRRNCSKYKCTLDVFLGGASSASSCAILDLPLCLHTLNEQIGQLTLMAFSWGCFCSRGHLAMVAKHPVMH